MESNTSMRATPARAPVPRAPQKPPRFFELIPPNLGVDFVRLAPTMIAVSLAAIVIGLASIWFHGGLNYGIDFVGGTMVQVRFPDRTSIADVRAALERKELHEVVVQDVGRDGREFQVRMRGADDDAASAAADVVRAGLKEKFGEGGYDILRVEAVGPKVGRALWRDAALAVLAATLMMGAYIWFRFDLRFGICAAVALAHDVLITIGAMSLADMEFDLTTVAALLTVVGFSVNDTVIISDRIRENLRDMRREPLAKIINLSINETLSRTIITNGTAILVTVVLFVLGGPVIHSFAFALLVGFIAGTYSSIYVACPLVLYMEGRGTRRR
jgi:preprotein translocase subunit SecF